MNEKLNNYVNGVFAPYEGSKSVAELKADLLSDLQERFQELKAEGKDDQTAFAMTLESIGDIEQTVREVANLSHSLERQVVINFGGSNLPQSDFVGVVAHQGKFRGSTLRGSDFSRADLTGSSFRSSDLREANFSGANLTDCDFTTLELTDANFNEAILVRTTFNVVGLGGAKFIDVKLTDVKFTKTDLRQTTFEHCSFIGVDFHSSDLRGQRLDGQTFIGVTFDLPTLQDVSFDGATLKNVSFRQTGIWSLRRAIESLHLDGAIVDKLTYKELQSLGADVSKVTVI
ncbi:pentapeptide repeat-containing protein [Ktedonosporobacter rubrisoli]|uniref:Pentapeptide repeat-containing protein n=1 Tax=Ktedonosporobacter rubrisoli TaxID=2509675 RepID=A0A4P6JKY0_KTERU|nr:pentapeptide repeat-containing protein [Ktedonosporobacter rubrisoli]QBD75660.1 pentapeptide repeat-containing protein [Ktedonosporobacter rubrisoli]